MTPKIANRTGLQPWFEQLQSSDPAERVTAASQLGRLGVRSRWPNITRGSFFIAAPNRLSPEQTALLLDALAGPHPDLRREVAFALGEWAGEEAIPPLSERAAGDPDLQTRIAAARALARIGGRQAVMTLRTLARHAPHEDVRAAAIEGLGTLAAASIVGEEDKTTEVAGLLRLLDEIRKADASQYVRILADGTLSRLAA